MAAIQPVQPPELPLISLRDLSSGNPAKVRAIADAIGQAARQFGFFRICDHGIDLDLIEATYHCAASFFALPDAAKRRFYIGDSPNHRGYVPFTEKGDYPDEVHRSYEAFDLGLDLPRDDPDFLTGNRVLGPNVWPDCPKFKRTVSQYYTQIASLGRLICGALEMHLGLPPAAMTGQMTKPISQLRLLHYVRQAHTSDHRSVNMGAHTDYECLTLLHTRNEGLQVMTAQDEWIDVPVDPSAFVVNIGDMLEAWSNGLLRSTPHRVVNSKPERFSMPYFVAANHDTIIQPFAELVSPDTPAKYEPFTAGAHLERMLMRDFPYLRHIMQQKSTTTSASPITPTCNPFEGRLTQSVS